MSGFSVESDHLRNMASQISGGASGIRGELDTLDNEVSKLRGSWSGGAQEAYTEAQQKWNQSISAMHAVLEQIASKTLEIADHYDQQDKTSAGRFS